MEHIAGNATNHAQQEHSHSMPAKVKHARTASHLMRFIANVQTSQPIPYLPVTASLSTGESPSTQAKLLPMLWGMGLHYAADASLLPSSARITLSIGVPNIRVMPSAARRFFTPQKIILNWNPRTAPGAVGTGQLMLPQGQGAARGVKGH